MNKKQKMQAFKSILDIDYPDTVMPVAGNKPVRNQKPFMEKRQRVALYYKNHNK